MKSIHWKQLASIAIGFVLAGCKIQIEAPPTADVLSESGNIVCKAGNHCVVEVENFDFEENFYVNAQDGYYFNGWAKGEATLCAGFKDMCRLRAKALYALTGDLWEAARKLVESDQTFYLRPDVRAADDAWLTIDELLNSTTDTGFKACIEKNSTWRNYPQEIGALECDFSVSKDDGGPVYDYTIESLEGIEHFPNLKKFVYARHYTRARSDLDASALGKLPKLRHLRINGADLNSSDFLRHLTELRHVNLSQTNLNNVAELASATKLHTLLLYGVQLDSLRALGDTNQLRRLGLAGTNVDDSQLIYISHHLQLEKLELQSNELTDITPLRSLTKLKTLDLGFNAISDAGPLADMLALTSLRLESNRVDDLSFLSNYRFLDYLNLSYNQIGNEDLAYLKGKSLSDLRLDHNLISDISALAEMRYVYFLGLDDNFVEDIDVLDNLRGLTYLTVSRNRVFCSDGESFRERNPHITLYQLECD
jgi:hypothetical protein